MSALELSPHDVTAEIDRILAARDTRQAAQRAKGKACVLRSLETRLEKFKLGTLGMCSCRSCLGGYITRNPDLLCLTGRHQFWSDTWQPWVQ